MSGKKENKDLLGKGIRSLLGSIDNELKTPAGKLKSDVSEAVTGITRIPLERIKPNPRQPRKDFNEKALQELAASIKMHDIIQPVTIMKMGEGYQLISGERRYRAAQIAGLKDIPAYVRSTNDSQVLELALLENLQREDLNAMEIAISYKRMMDELDYTQEQVAERMGRERTTVTNYLRLLKLPPNIQLSLRNNEISFGHARAIAGVEEADKQLFVFREIKEKSLSVRQAEDLARKVAATSQKPVKTSVKTQLAPVYQRIEDKLASQFSTRVKLKHGKKGNGTITFEYHSLEEFNRLLGNLNVNIS
ncbi:MAG: ParB/RepB/Spo0J family partition protein [Dinghuibacter sp.]|nr:ParB/RepB/Spo0J family partition protein [Dinghuibacter sp.]